MMTWRLLVGDVREQLAELPDGSVQTCVTSPPYWGLRDYGVAGQLGVEQTPDAYVAAMVEVFREARRALSDDGTLWLNLGDSYQNAKGQAHGVDTKQPARRFGLRPQDVSIPGLKPKDLVGIPWMVAFALRADGWYLRADIIWSKPNPMPESVQDRPTKAHEYIFLLSKSRAYYYDSDAVREDFVDQPSRLCACGHDELEHDRSRGCTWVGLGAICECNEYRPKESRASYKPGSASSMNAGQHVAKSDDGLPLNPAGRNARSVWTITAQPYPEAHFATFPESLPERCIKAGSRPGDVVLDPFNGSGTTGAVALKLGRSYIGIELNPQYAEMARQRIGRANPLFAQEVA